MEILTFLFLVKHFEHPICNHKTTYHIQRSQHYRKETQYQCYIIIAVRLPHYNDGTDDNHTVYGLSLIHI